MPPTPIFAGTTGDGWPIYRIAGKQYFLKNNRLFILGKETPADPSIQEYVIKILAKEVVKSTPVLLKKPVGEIGSLVRELLKRKAQLEVADNSWNTVLFAKKVAQRVRVILAAKKLRILGQRRVSINDEKKTIRYFRTDEPLYPLNPAYDLPRNAEHPFRELPRN